MAPTTLEQLVVAGHKNYAPLNTYLTSIGRDPTTFWFPRAGASPGAKTDVPFGVVEYSGQSGHYVLHTGFTAHIFDKPGERYWRIDEIGQHLSNLFDGYHFPPTATGYSWYLQCRLDDESAPDVDESWNLLCKRWRFSIVGAL